jgi:hypothetical protein
MLLTIYNDAEIFRISLTILFRIDTVKLVVILGKLVKPTGGGEPAGLSLFLFYSRADEIGKNFKHSHSMLQQTAIDNSYFLREALAVIFYY